jgi:hypothetical protein
MAAKMEKTRTPGIYKNGACSRQRARQLDEDGQAGVQPNPLKARDSKRQ